MAVSVKAIEYAKPRTGEPIYECFEQISLLNAVMAYMSYIILHLLGRLQEFLRKHGVLNNPSAKENILNKSFIPLYYDYEAFYGRNLFRRVRDCLNRPVCSTPGPEIVLMDRVSYDSCWTFK